MAKKKAVAAKPAASSSTPIVTEYRASIWPRQTLDETFAKQVIELEQLIKRDVWVFSHGSSDNPRLGSITRFVRDLFLTEIRAKSPKGKPIALLINSPGGDPRAAYQIAKGIRQHCGEFDVYVPRYAKSAATLLSLGAEKIWLGDNAELGPLDMQIADAESEEWRSVLEYVQSLERLESYALRFLDDAMTLLLARTNKKQGSLLPHAVEMSTSVVRPLFQNVDVVQYTQMARLLKVMEDYASRLLRGHMTREDATRIARDLTSKYSDHSFVIDRDELKGLGLSIPDTPDEVSKTLDGIASTAWTESPIFGRVQGISK